jgi:Flp pilus assembly protein TadD
LQADPASVEALRLLGLLAHQAGNWGQAIACYREALRLRPGLAEVHNSLGAALAATGLFPDALSSFQEAVKLEPSYAEAHDNLGTALRLVGRLRDAEISYRKALELRSNFPQAHLHLGVVLALQGQLADAVTSFQTALRHRPDYVDGYMKLGDILKQLGRLEEAESAYRPALQLRPNLVEAHSSLGAVLTDRGQLMAAQESLHTALRLRPGFAQAHHYLGYLYQRMGQADEAEASYREALRLGPAAPQFFNNLGSLLLERGRLEEATACFQEALRLDPSFAGALSNVGVALQADGQFAEAEASFEQALRVDPAFAEARHNRSMLWLLQGKFEQGWPEYEWRWRTRASPLSSRPEPLWDGKHLRGKSILLYTEQGRGDTLHFIRYAAMVKQQGATVVVACPRELLGVLAGCPGVERLLPEDGPLPACDVRSPLLSLPGRCGTTLSTIPAQVPYLVADRGRVSHWRNYLAAVPGFKVGICWQGSPRHRDDRRRSVPLEQFAPLTTVPGVRLLSLQRGFGQEQWTKLAGYWPVVEVTGLAPDPAEAWVDSAALLGALDLVITVDTAVAHLAGALAVPVWVALPFAPDWRWLLGREDSPWYPTMRLFRQTRQGDWSGVFKRIAEALRNGARQVELRLGSGGGSSDAV